MSALIVASAALMLAASAHDIAARTVPNWIPLILAAIGLAARVYDGTLIPAAEAAAATFVIAALLWRFGWMGGGDVKLLGATALAVPPSDVLPLIVVMSLAGAGLAFAYLAARRFVRAPSTLRPRTLIARILRAERWRICRGAGLPYACAIAFGGLFVLL